MLAGGLTADDREVVYLRLDPDGRVRLVEEDIAAIADAVVRKLTRIDPRLATLSGLLDEEPPQ